MIQEAGLLEATGMPGTRGFRLQSPLAKPWEPSLETGLALCVESSELGLQRRVDRTALLAEAVSGAEWLCRAWGWS